MPDLAECHQLRAQEAQCEPSEDREHFDDRCIAGGQIGQTILYVYEKIVNLHRLWNMFVILQAR